MYNNNFDLNESESLKRINQEQGIPIIVPGDVRYISEWPEYQTKYLFDYPHILDKKIPGCGYTEFCLRSKLNVVLCSPRRVLLENKAAQHPDDVFYAKNELEKSLRIDKDLIRKPGSADNLIKEIDEIEKIQESVEERKSQYVKLYRGFTEYKQRMQNQGKPLKILVTYDSFHIIREFLEDGIGKFGMTGFGILDSFQVVVDEFQSIFTDAIFKSSTEMKFMKSLEGIQKVCYVSATPMVGTYLAMIPEFANLPMYYLDWKSMNTSRIIKPDLKVRTMRSVRSTAKGIIDTYRAGKFAMKIVSINDKDGRSINKEVYSREAVFYVNSVSNIISIISNSDLKPEEVNILCADTKENRKKITNRLGSKFTIGKVPLRGELHKMFTFCTRTVYLGADFYSDNARTFILSDANIQSMAVDISLDLPQILGRQRLWSNPWKNSAEFYYISRNVSKDKTENDFRDGINKKLRGTRNILDIYEDALKFGKDTSELTDTYEREAVRENYRYNYVAANRTWTGKYDSDGSKIMEIILTENQLAFISDLRAYDIQHKDYADRFSVFSALNESFSEGYEDSTEYLVQVTVNYFNSLESNYDKIRYLCQRSRELEGTGLFIEILNQISDCYRNYFSKLSVDEIEECNCNPSRILNRISTKSENSSIIVEKIFDQFKVGDRVSTVFIKETLREIYDSIGYRKAPKASDLNEYFILRAGKFKNSQGKWEHGFEILEQKLN